MNENKIQHWPTVEDYRYNNLQMYNATNGTLLLEKQQDNSSLILSLNSQLLTCCWYIYIFQEIKQYKLKGLISGHAYSVTGSLKVSSFIASIMITNYFIVSSRINCRILHNVDAINSIKTFQCCCDSIGQRCTTFLGKGRSVLFLVNLRAEENIMSWTFERSV